MFHENNRSVQRQISTLLYKHVSGKKSKTQENRKLLLECMESTGYIKEPDQEHEDVFYHPDFPVEPDEQIVYKQERQATFVPKESKFYKTQIRGISYEEQDLANVSDQINDVLNKLQKPDLPYDKIRESAINMYSDIIKVYRTTNILKGEMKGSVRNGYILLVVYYTLLRFKVCVSKADLVNYFNMSLSDLPQADKNIKMVLGVVDNFHELCLCTFSFDTATRKEIQNVIFKLKELGKFSDPVSLVQVAATIYYVTKGMPGFDYAVISKRCGLTPDTIRKTVKVIEKYF
jgi:hypothetical protein